MLNSTETSVSHIRPITQSTTRQPNLGSSGHQDSFTAAKVETISPPQIPKDPYGEMVWALRQRRDTHQIGTSRKALRAFLGSEAFDNLSQASKLPQITRFQGMGNLGRFNEQKVQQILLSGKENSLLRVLQDVKTTREDILEAVQLLQDMLCLQDVLLDSEQQSILQLRNSLILLIGPSEADARKLFGPEGAKYREMSLKVTQLLSNPNTSFDSLLAAEKEVNSAEFMPNREYMLNQIRHRISAPISLELNKVLTNYMSIPANELGLQFDSLQKLHQQIASLKFFPDQNGALIQIHNALEKISFRTQKLLEDLLSRQTDTLNHVQGDAWKFLKYPQAKETLKTLKCLIAETESVQRVLGYGSMRLSELQNAAAILSHSVKVLELVGWKETTKQCPV